ncbi:hypothetical protein HYH03_012876 [Edaphochlamys debaryana]|uniref:Uncharacterized protein n=1 Tax=Edaphochlamys debaryana TaxID=47281 RepID=A0A835XRZ8_9CHLO|nr:hypothetical protein HYH03_012876 [Edaphochlamys debaryana]|eukprot:KAG2488557.1 hypothetical protein HYH03_012876 [Edaphochlamys debaryana]
MDADVLKIYLEAKAEPVVETICSMVDLDLATRYDRAVFLVSSEPPKRPKDWDDDFSLADSSEDETLYSAHGSDGAGAPSQLYVSRFTGRGKPRKVAKSESAYGHCWVVNSEGTKHADLLAGRVSTGLLQVVTEGIARRHPHLQASLYAYRVGASGEGSGAKRSRQQRDARGPQHDAQGQAGAEAEVDEYAHEEDTVQLVCVRWST